MTELSCPVCGRPVRVPQAKTDTTYVCRKCHSPFHLNKSGQTVVGDPPVGGDDLEEIKQKVRQKLEWLTTKRVVAVLGTLVVAWAALHFLLRPAERLGPVAEQAARAVADNDLDTLKSMAAPGTAEDVARWFEQVHPRLVQERARWGGREEAVEVSVAQEDRAQRRGSVAVSIHPILGSTRDVSIADPTQAVANAASPVDLNMVWSLDRWGHWKLDGRETYSKSHP